MAEIRSFPLFRHLRAEPTSHILLFKGGRKRRSGAGLAFWFTPLGASLAEVPLEDRDLAFLVSTRSADYQEVHVNGVVTVRTADPELLAARIDFSVGAATGRFRGDPLDKLAAVVVQRAQELGAGFLGGRTLAALLEGGVDDLRQAVARGLAEDAGLATLGIAVVATRILSVKPSPELEKALQLPARERIQQAADEATFARRALAVDKERAIQENELANKIELARREEKLIAQRGANENKRVSDESEARRIAAEGAARDARVEAEAAAQAIRVKQEARVSSERERMAIYRDLPSAALFGLAARELANNLGKIEHLSLSPDTFGPLLQRVLGAQARHLEESSGAEKR